MRTVILDNEAVQALRHDHPKHRAVVAHLEAVATRRRRGQAVEALVPTSVRVEAGWDRSRSASAALNRFRVRDHALDGHAANTAAGIATATRTSVADAHLGAAARDQAGDVVVLSSDPRDMAAVCGPIRVTIVAI